MNEAIVIAWAFLPLGMLALAIRIFLDKYEKGKYINKEH
jgi:hypothetical protein